MITPENLINIFGGYSVLFINSLQPVTFKSVFAKMNGYAPFSKQFFTSKVGGLNRLNWVGMLSPRGLLLL